MSDHHATLHWIESQRQTMTDLAVQWAGINTHTFNQDGLAMMADELTKAFGVFSEAVERIDLAPFSIVDENGNARKLPLGNALIIQKRIEAPKQALLVCHMDTVYPADHPFQEVRMIDDNTINGPGITDAKGGIVVLLKALAALEKSPCATKIGWTVIINPDEEIGSPSSAQLLKKYAGQCHLGLVFEPCLSNGHLVAARKGSGNFTLMAAGKAAHAGRNIEEGKNAIDALVQCIAPINALYTQREGLTVNTGIIKGGTARNVVAEKAIVNFNIRFPKEEDFAFVQQEIHKIITAVSQETGVNISCGGNLSAAPKLLTDQTLHVLKYVQNCGKAIGLDIQWEDSGGVCDGNRLQANGLPTVDTLGVQGGAIHSSEEYLLVHSLAERTKLAALTLLKWASDEWSL